MTFFGATSPIKNFFKVWPMFGGMLIHVLLDEQQILFKRSGNNLCLWAYWGGRGENGNARWSDGQWKPVATREGGAITIHDQGLGRITKDGNFTIDLDDVISGMVFDFFKPKDIPPNPFQIR